MLNMEVKTTQALRKFLQQETAQVATREPTNVLSWLEYFGKFSIIQNGVEKVFRLDFTAFFNQDLPLIFKSDKCHFALTLCPSTNSSLPLMVR